MKASEILDHYEHDFHSLMDRDDKILWSGDPNAKGRLPLLHLDKDSFGGPSVLSAGPATVVFVWLTIISIYTYVLFSRGDYVQGSFLILLTIFLLLIPNILMSIRQRNTAYAITKKGVLFKLWWYGKVKHEFVNWSDVSAIQTTVEPDGNGTIHFMCNENVQFFTYDFTKAKKRFNPTFEDIEDAEYWAAEFRQIKKDASKYKYTD